MEDVKILGVIPARGGSKGIKDKNITLLCGKPLLFYTIETAKKTKRIDRLILSTDSPKIRKLVANYNIEIYSRPKSLAKDCSKLSDALIYILKKLKKREGYRPYGVITLQPTSPFRKKQDIEKGIDKFLKKGYDCLFSVCEAEHHPYWMHRLVNGEPVPLFNITEKQRQSLAKIYRENGVICIVKTDYLLAEKKIFGGKMGVIVMDRFESVDIDTELDLKIAEFLLQK